MKYKFWALALMGIFALGIAVSAFGMGGVRSTHSTTALVFKEYVTGSGAAIHFGVDDDGIDVKFFGATSGAYALWDESADAWIFNAMDLHLGDTDYILFGDDASGDIALGFDGTQLTLIANTDDTVAVHLGSSTKASDVKWFDMAAGYVEADAGNSILRLEQVDLELGDADFILFGDDAAGDITLNFDGTQLVLVGNTDDTVAVHIGSSTKASDLKWFNVGSGYVEFNAGDARVTVDAVDVYMQDDDHIYFGDAGAEGNIYSNAADLIIMPAADGDMLRFGLAAVTQLAWDMTWYGNTSADSVIWDGGANRVEYDGIDLILQDDDIFELGDSMDVSMVWDGTFDIKPLIDDQKIYFGIPEVTQLSWDIWWYGNTSANTVEFDASGDIINVTDVEMLFGEDDAINFYDTAVNIQALDDGHLDLTADISIDLNGDVTCSGHVDGVVFHANAFQYPAPGTDFTPELGGAGLAASKSAKYVWIPLNFLKAGDEIVSYKLVGCASESTALTVDAALYSVEKACPVTTTAITDGAITQVDSNGVFDVEADCSDITVTTDYTYTIQVLATTGATDKVVVMGAEVMINRKL